MAYEMTDLSQTTQICLNMNADQVLKMLGSGHLEDMELMRDNFLILNNLGFTPTCGIHAGKVYRMALWLIRDWNNEPESYTEPVR